MVEVGDVVEDISKYPKEFGLVVRIDEDVIYIKWIIHGGKWAGSWLDTFDNGFPVVDSKMRTFNDYYIILTGKEKQSILDKFTLEML